MRLVSQPSARLPLQFAKPALQLRPQAPLTHVGVPLGGGRAHVAAAPAVADVGGDSRLAAIRRAAIAVREAGITTREATDPVHTGGAPVGGRAYGAAAPAVGDAGVEVDLAAVGRIAI